MKKEVEELYERVLAIMTLYNQYSNNVGFDKASIISRAILKVNDLAIRNGLYKGDVLSSVHRLEKELVEEGIKIPSLS